MSPSTAPQRILEEERSYVLPAGAALAPLDRVLPDVLRDVLAGGSGGGGLSLSEPRVERLDATYVDTADLRLATRGVRMRRRTGGGDAGWHLKMPSSVGVVEMQLPVGRSVSAVPRQLCTLVLALTRGAPLAPVARLRTRRIDIDLLAAGGTVLATVSDDDVSGQRMGGEAVLQRWREFEVELGHEPSVTSAAADGGHARRMLLDRVEVALLTAGALPAEHPSKVAKVLGAVPPPWPAARPAGLKKSSAGWLLTLHLREQVDALLGQDPRVRLDEEDSVHKMRVATRRARSALRTFRPLLDEPTARAMGEDLKWLAAVLGDLRDREVTGARILSDVRSLPVELVRGPVVAHIESVLTRDFAAARRAALKELEGERYLRVLDRLMALAADPPLTEAAFGKASAVVPPLIGKIHKRLGRELTHAAAQEDAARRDPVLHDGRKTSKRLRYAAESVAPAFGAPATELAERAEAVQEVLGEHQDAVVAAGVLADLSVRARGADEDGFTYGVLVGLERSRAELGASEAAALWKRLKSWRPADLG